MGHLFFADNAIMKHTLQFMVLEVYHAADVEQSQRKERLFVDIVLMPKRCHQIEQSIIIKQDDYLCSTCYKTHCSIIESFKSPYGSDAMLNKLLSSGSTNTTMKTQTN